MHHELNQALSRLALHDPNPLAETAGATLWRVRQTDGTHAVLKLHKRADRGNEAAGSALLQAWADRGAVRILAEDGAAIVMEWLEGPSLADVAITDDPRRAVVMLAEVAQRLHEMPVLPALDLPELPTVLAPVLDVHCAQGCPDPLRESLKEASALARHLLNTATDLRPLHGDLHHSNVIVTHAGPRVLDAKGYHGDIGYELANAFRHPGALPQLLRDPDWITWCRDIFANALDVPEQRLAQWAAVKCALSIVWRTGGPVSDDPEADLLSGLLASAREV
ncbi:aminoglycoside phosphotransferase family protein [Falsiruegeria mediterranea]|uniref:Aminoglycoside/hydroxyurea antibiotic resistance kinase n=1 Tax=Falsiruegeria mediterranea M17 TaxID=1200281 RepID=A0A2R8CF23_9RHOB|nr:aminoglycoside phosphotransferase family protein [Falsiruegeria mediterranea]SPJ30999.1 hypothetical protein TRM7615_04536 [Falsiruegeria mediterranea M17]